MALIQQSVGAQSMTFKPARRKWPPELGIFLSADAFAYHDARGTLWSWPNQNPVNLSLKFQHGVGVSDDLAHLPFQIPPHRKVVHLLLVLDDNQQVVVTLVARLLIVHPIAARTRTKQDEHVDRNRHIRTCEHSRNGLKFLLLVVGKVVDRGLHGGVIK